MTPLVQSSGTVVSFQIVLKSGCRKSAAIAGSALNSSALKLSSTGALPSFFRVLIAAIISPLVDGPVLISRSVSASCMLASTSGGGLFKISLKFSAHLVCCLASVVRSLPCLSAIGATVVILRLPALRTRVILYTLSYSPLLAASSACLARLSTNARLSTLTFLLTSWFIS